MSDGQHEDDFRAPGTSGRGRSHEQFEATIARAKRGRLLWSTKSRFLSKGEQPLRGFLEAIAEGEPQK